MTSKKHAPSKQTPAAKATIKTTQPSRKWLERALKIKASIEAGRPVARPADGSPPRVTANNKKQKRMAVASWAATEKKTIDERAAAEKKKMAQTIDERAAAQKETIDEWVVAENQWIEDL